SVHFIGIGGIGMSGIAKVLLQLGYEVSGSDLKQSSITEKLTALGGRIHVGHDALHVNGADVVVCSSAVPEGNVELQQARSNGIPVAHRSEMLAAIMDRQRGIAIAGTHGKSTTTSMIAFVLERARLDPTVLVGGELNDIGGNAKFGRGEFCVVEADESDGSLLNLRPERAVVTNVELDHPDYFETEEKLYETFRSFVSRIPATGALVACYQCGNVAKVVDGSAVECPVVTYGLGPNSDYSASHWQPTLTGVAFQLQKRAGVTQEMELSVPGRHNVLNALGTIAMCESVGVDMGLIAEVLPQFRGINRRWQTILKTSDIWIVDDYAHHPSEVAATLAAAKGFEPGRVIAVFQPHRYSRTKALCEDFGRAFADADYVIINEIYGVHEDPIPGVTGEAVAAAIRRNTDGRPVEYIADRNAICERLMSIAAPGDLILTMGAGDIYTVAKAVAERIGG
ncbi:MAG: UDP-N-acetylmuramate--L-alanine ligase, partial [Armatimonadetes bacterium]|nr:UDP-N-acetylmuramate--L-alanine ligase [Armatimonadota bacterium]